MNRRTAGIVLSLVLVLVLSGCAAIIATYSAPKYRTLANGQVPAPGEVLVIGNFVFDPPVRQGVLNYYDPWDAKQNIYFALTGNLDTPVDLEAIVPIVPEEILLAEYGATSFTPMPPGTRYLRMGSYTITSYCSAEVIGPQGGCRAMHSEYVTLSENIRIDIPAGAAAVYIGTIVFEHDGETGTRTHVRDEFRSMLAELDSLGIPGIDSRNVSKQLAEIVDEQIVRR